MVDVVTSFLKRFIPKKIFKFFAPYYHYSLAWLGDKIYRHPTGSMYVIGVTGTKGKSTVVYLLNSILEKAGYKTACLGTIEFRIAGESRPNLFKMTMPGRFFVQKFLNEARSKGCTHAIIEITSESTLSFRHQFLDLDAFVFTNLAPEHIESHGSFENYRDAKLKIADRLALGQKPNTLMVVNGDNEYSGHFLEKKADKKIIYKLSDAAPIDLSYGIKMRFNKTTIYSHLDGEFNVSNILAASKTAEALGIGDEKIKEAIESIQEIPGRVQKIIKKNVTAVIDYAHTPDSLTALYKAFPNHKKVCVLGNTGGGRDTWKRPVMGKIADQYCDEIILTNEDPYDEDPQKIVNEMKSAITQKPVKTIMDRRQAIGYALTKAKSFKTEKAAVLITGKGTDPYIMEAKGKKTPWSDYQVTQSEISKI